jgi:arginyl-tRNA synthetase
MSIADEIRKASKTALEKLYSLSIDEMSIQINETKPEFAGDYTLVLFPFIKLLKRSPEQLGKEIGEEMVTNNTHLFSSYNIIKGFLNFTVNDSFWFDLQEKQRKESNG